MLGSTCFGQVEMRVSPGPESLQHLPLGAAGPLAVRELWRRRILEPPAAKELEAGWPPRLEGGYKPGLPPASLPHYLKCFLLWGAGAAYVGVPRSVLAQPVLLLHIQPGCYSSGSSRPLAPGKCYLSFRRGDSTALG